MGMRPFLRRRRWWFLGAIGLAALGTTATFLVVDVKRSAAYDRVHVGMKSIQAHRILMDAGAEDLGSCFRLRSVGKFSVVYSTAYMLGNDRVEIVWDEEGSVYHKTLTKGSWPDRVLAWLAPIRAAVGL
jgi:hypothetical protein